jgi:hypothetical protein
MRQLWHLGGFALVLTGLLTFTSGDVLGQKKKNKQAQDDGYPAAQEDYAKIKYNKELFGTILSIDATTKSLNIRVQWSHYEPNEKYKPPQPGKGATNAQNQYNRIQQQMYQTSMRLQQEQQNVLNARTPQQAQQAMNRMQQDMMKLQQEQQQLMNQMNIMAAQGTPVNNNPNNQPYKVVTAPLDYTLEIKEDVVVRKMFLPMEYDDTGNVKEYTEKEKAELRGKDKTKPGYTAKFEDVLTGQEVRIALTPPPSPKAKDKDKDKPKPAKDMDKDKDAKTDDAPAEPMVDTTRPTVNMIVMTKDMMQSSIDPSSSKNQKKNK